MRGLPPAQARELKEQITAHLDDALRPDASDQEVAATLSRLGSPADLAAEAGAASGSPGPRFALSSWRMRWRLAAVIAIPTVIAAVLGALQISSDASSYLTSGRDQHLAQLDAAVVTLTQNLEDERDLSAAYVARGEAGPVPVTLADARTATDAAARAVRADAAGIGAGYQPGTVQDLDALLASLTDLEEIRTAVSSSAFPASQVIRVYTGNVIGPANTFSAAVGDGTGDARLQGTVTTLAALLRVENDQSVKRAILYAALSAQPPVLATEDLTSLQQADAQERADLTDFNGCRGHRRAAALRNTVSGAAVDLAATQRNPGRAVGRREPVGAADPEHRAGRRDVVRRHEHHHRRHAKGRRPASRPDHRPGEHPEVERDQEPAAHQHHHGPAARAADLGRAGPPAGLVATLRS